MGARKYIATFPFGSIICIRCVGYILSQIGTPKVYTKLYKNPKRKLNYLGEIRCGKQGLLLLLLLLLPHFHISAIGVSVRVRLGDDAGTEYSGCFLQRSVPILI